MFSHFDELHFGITVVAAFGVGRVVPESEDPLRFRFSEVLDEPLGHLAVGGAIEIVGVQADDVDVTVVEGIEGLRFRRHAAGLAFSGAHVGIIVGTYFGFAIGRLALMIAHGGPANFVLKSLLIRFEKLVLKLSVSSRGCKPCLPREGKSRWVLPQCMFAWKSGHQVDVVFRCRSLPPPRCGWGSLCQFQDEW